MNMRIRAYHRVAAVLLAKLMLLDICYPTLAFALTGGPSQPEFESFEPVSTDQMVDLFTGDFTYNIPLMTVPGPNGGYPINLAYHAGIGMEQEASWVGLGWNINVGEINRMMRGLPDDFNGDDVEQTTHIRPNNTFGIELRSTDTEVLGFDPGVTGVSSMLYVNNYKGVGLRAGAKLSHAIGGDDAKGQLLQGLVGGLSTTFDSQGGLEMEPSISLEKTKGTTKRRLTLAPKIHSRYGLYDFNASWTKRTTRSVTVKGKDKKDKTFDVMGTKGAGVSFGASAFVPTPFAPLRGVNFKVGLQAGASSALTWLQGLSLSGLYSSNYIRQEDITRTASAYGYLHSESRNDDDHGLMDYHRDKDVAVTRRNPYAPMPVYTYDSYIINGQGTGGVFRPYRSDIGLLKEDQTALETDGAELVPEIGGGTAAWKIGGDIGHVHSVTYSGDWLGGKAAIDGTLGTDLNAHRRDPQLAPLYEPFYFRLAGERTANAPGPWNDFTEGPLRFDLGLMADPYLGLTPRIHNTLANGSSIAPSQTARPEREKRVNNIEYRTIGQITSDAGFSSNRLRIYPRNQAPTPSNGADFAWTGAPSRDHHIGEVSVLNPDGTKYIYGLPAYNTTQVDYAFAIDAPSSPGAVIPYEDATTHGPDSEELIKNNYGEDHFYSRTRTPGYAHSFLLTAVYSADYVDVTGNGPTEDDLGYYVKFNYSALGDTYRWRVPFSGVNYVPGKYSNERDDKATFSYGEKAIYYLNSIETSTHIATFTLADRADGRGAAGVQNSPPSNLGATLQRLTRIDLYSKADGLQTPLKSVHFDQDYSLCPGVDNTATSNGGKLALKRLYFTYQNNERGSLTPYEFAYANATRAYEKGRIDRWGNPTNKTAQVAIESPYVDQVESAVDRNALVSAWCLNEITLPSGSVIHVDYESDDYAYVQDKPAMQMCRILGTNDVHDAPSTPSGTDFKLKRDDRRIYFQMNDPDDDPADYVDGVTDLYFKTHQRLKRYPVGDGHGVDDWAYDYVDGYARITPGSAGKLSGTAIGYFTVDEKTYNSGASEVHPFRFAGWQYIRYERPDLLYPANDLANNSVIGTAMIAAVNLMFSSIQLLTGFYNNAGLHHYCLELRNSDLMPSFVRLNSPRRWEPGVVEHAGKFGGGVRVAAITVSDNWEEGAALYGKSYTYRMKEGDRWISSGVAEYEPQSGGEEIALRNPIWYNGSDARLSFRNEDAYIETPLGESLYPAPSVGYQQVTVRDIVDGNEADVKLAQNGSVVHEFYTARDFPVRVRSTPMETANFAPPLILIPFVGTLSFNNHGYSQGYCVELNDMHGKQKAVSTYGHGADPTAPPKSRTAYVYKTRQNDPHALDNKVNVLSGHFTQQEAELGRTTDFFVDLQESTSRSHSVGMSFNLDGVGIFGIPTAIPGLEYAVNMFRSVVTNKVIQRVGILDHVVSEVDGARTTTTNLLFDAYTGDPLLTTTTNAWEDPVYTYTYAAHMAYDGMAGAYRNWGASVNITHVSGADFKCSNVSIPPSTVFFPGDEVIGNNNVHYWVTAATTTAVTLKTAADANAPNSLTNVRIARSGHRNMQAVKNGTIVSLTNPLESYTMHSFFQQHNAQVFNQRPPFLPDHTNAYDVQSCKYGLGAVDYRLGTEVDPGGAVRHKMVMKFFAYPHDIDDVPGCLCPIVFYGPDPNGWNASEEAYDIEFLGFTGEYTTEGYPLLQIRHWQDGSYVVLTGYWQGFDECFGHCIPDVLHADATEYDDTWSYDYADAGIAALTGNPYRTGASGLWRPSKTHLFQVDRDNVAGERTDIRKDGTYRTFEKFNFADPGSNTDRWVKREEMTRYSPFGFALESLDALNVPSCALYGYGNSQLVAQATAAGYHEVAFDGFEDHPATYESGHGHVALLALASDPPSAAPTLVAGGHTGAKSARIGTGQVLQLNGIVDYSLLQNWVPQAGKRYVVSAWFKTASGQAPAITVLQNGTPMTPLAVQDDGAVIEGWRKVEVEFQAPAGGNTVQVRFLTTGATGNAYVDDIRIAPASATLKSYVYDRGLHRLLAELDERNYATFYNYDEEGTLVQVKKETERGVVTLRTSRRYITPLP